MICQYTILTKDLPPAAVGNTGEHGLELFALFLNPNDRFLYIHDFPIHFHLGNPLSKLGFLVCPQSFHAHILGAVWQIVYDRNALFFEVILDYSCVVGATVVPEHAPILVFIHFD